MQLTLISASLTLYRAWRLCGFHRWVAMIRFTAHASVLFFAAVVLASLLAGLPLPAATVDTARHADLVTQLKSSDPQQRLDAVRQLATIGDAMEDADALLHALHDTDPHVHLAAIVTLRALNFITSDEGLPKLLADPDPAVRIAAAQLIYGGNPAVLATLKKMLQDPLLAVRVAAVDGLVRTHDRQVIALVLALLHDQISELRRAAARATIELSGNEGSFWLDDLKPPDDQDTTTWIATVLHWDTIKSALAAMLNDADAGVRHSAAVALFAFGDDRATRTMLIAALDDDDAATREAAVKQMRVQWHDDPEIIRHFITMLPGEKAASVRRVLVDVLSAAADSQAADVLLREVNDPDAQIRKSVIGTLKQRATQGSKDPRVVDVLLPRLKDADADIRYETASALAEFNDARIIPALLDAAEDANPRVSDTAFRALIHLHDPCIRSVADKFLHSADPRLRRAAAMALGAAGDERGFRTLAGLLRDAKRRLDDEVLQFLGSAKDTRALNVLLCIDNIADDERKPYFRALANYPHDLRVVQRLIDDLRDPRPQVRLAVLEISPKFDDLKLRVAIGRLMKDRNARVRSAVIPALITHLPFTSADLPALKLAFVDKDPIIRAETVGSLNGFGGREVDKLLLRMLQQEKDPQVIESLGQALYDRLQHMSVTEAQPLLQNRNASVRLAALTSLSNAHAPRLLATALHCVKDADELVRLQAVEILVNYDTPQVDEALKHAFNDKEIGVRQEVMQAGQSPARAWLRAAIVRVANDPHDPLVQGGNRDTGT